MKMEKMISMEWIGFSECPDTLQYKGKTEAKTAGSRRGTRRKTAQPGKASSTTAVWLTTAWPWWSPRAGRGAHCGSCPVVLPRAPHFGLSVFRLGPRVFAFSWVFWVSLLSSFDPHGPNFFSLDSSQTFLPKSRLES